MENGDIIHFGILYIFFPLIIVKSDTRYTHRLNDIDMKGYLL